MSILLDLVRGLAALVVLIGHTVDLSLYRGYIPHHPLLAHNAVIVFFVLSGLVITHSVHSRNVSLPEFAIARIARIVPAAWFAIVFAALLFALSKALDLPEGLPPPHDKANWATLLLPFAFMSESLIGQGAVWNPPYWSLAYEVWFYILFAVAIFLKGRQRFFWMAVCAVLAGWKVLLLLPIWLMGAALVKWADRLCISLKMAPLAVLAGLGLFLTAHHYAWGIQLELIEFSGMTREEWGFSNLFLTDTFLGLGIALIFIGLRPVANVIAPVLEWAKAPIRWLAGFSFTLYLLHMPMLLIVRGHGIGAKDNFLAFLILIGFVIVTCALIARLVEHKSPALRRLLTQRFLQGEAGAVAAEKLRAKTQNG